MTRRVKKDIFHIWVLCCFSLSLVEPWQHFFLALGSTACPLTPVNVFLWASLSKSQNGNAHKKSICLVVGIAQFITSFMLPSSEFPNNSKGHINTYGHWQTTQGGAVDEVRWDCWLIQSSVARSVSGHQYLVIISLSVVKSGQSDNAHKQWVT